MVFVVVIQTEQAVAQQVSVQVIREVVRRWKIRRYLIRRSQTKTVLRNRRESVVAIGDCETVFGPRLVGVASRC